jgi:signal transduction histidine kinase/CheY-like chemotaxis protein
MDTPMQEPRGRAYHLPSPLSSARECAGNRTEGALNERMRVWRTKTEKASEQLLGVARAAVAGASRDELLKEAVKELGSEGNADRIGVWVEAESSLQFEGPGRFQGLVWDRENGEMPFEWSHLSIEPPLPEEALFAGKCVEQDLEDLPDRPIIGPLVELRRATWIPIERNGQLKGVILAGSRGKQEVMRLGKMQSIAAGLALAIALEEEQRNASIRDSDLRAAREILEARRTRNPAGMILARLAESCTKKVAGEQSPGATFAVIGVLVEPAGDSVKGWEMEFRWQSGDQEWARAVASEPLADIWRRALEMRQVIGSEPHGAPAHGSLARILAYPLEEDGQLLGALVAGLPRNGISLATLERLELRAALSAAELGRRKRNEEEARDVEWQRTLLHSTSEAIILLDESGKITGSSRGVRELTRPASKGEENSSPGVRTGESFAGLFRTGALEGVEEWLRGACEGETGLGSAAQDAPHAELHNGISVRLRSVGPAPGRGRAILLEPMQAHESSRQSSRAETELQSVLEWLEEGVLLFDAHENVRAVNTRFEQIAGLSPGESGEIRTLEGWIARLAKQSAAPKDFAERWRELARGIEGGVREELQMSSPSPRILERASRPVLDAFARQIGRVEIYRDRTAQMVFHSKLLQTEKLAMIGQMVSGIAHELSNPLTSILGYAQRLLSRREGDGRSLEAQQIFQEAERAGKILRQLLLNAREMLPERRTVSLNQIVTQAVELQRSSLEAERIRVQIDLDADLPAVHGDPGQLQQVVMNLLGNSRHAIEQQGRGGTIRLRTRKIGEQRIVMEVEDDGPGVPQSIQARIFDPFFTTKPAGVGTGLGLSIVLSVVREHGGRVQVMNPPGGGAVFRIELPASSARPQEETRAAPKQERKTPQMESTQRAPREEQPSAARIGTTHAQRVLVVEDEPTVARLLGDVLEDEGFQVDVLLNGREALDRAGREPYDLVICDMKMPGLDGQNFYKSLVRAGNPISERFLFVTGDTVAAQTREFLERNHLPHVAKPFRVEELTEKVHRVLESKLVRAAPSRTAVRKSAARNG